MNFCQDLSERRNDISFTDEDKFCFTKLALAKLLGYLSGRLDYIEEETFLKLENLVVTYSKYLCEVDFDHSPEPYLFFLMLTWYWIEHFIILNEQLFFCRLGKIFIDYWFSKNVAAILIQFGAALWSIFIFKPNFISRHYQHPTFHLHEYGNAEFWFNFMVLSYILIHFDSNPQSLGCESAAKFLQIINAFFC